MISASGEDKVGLVDRLSSRIAESGCNIEESRMAVLGESARAHHHSQANPEAGAEAAGGSLQRGSGGDGPSRRRAHLATFFSRNGINIEELRTDTYPAPHTGTTMFFVHMTVGIHADIHISTLRGNFLDYCDDLNLDATFEPVRG